MATKLAVGLAASGVVSLVNNPAEIGQIFLSMGLLSVQLYLDDVLPSGCRRRSGAVTDKSDFVGSAMH